MKTLVILLVCFVCRATLAQSVEQKLERFRAETNFLVKHAFVSDLMQTGGESAFWEFKRGVFDKSTTRTLKVREEAYMLSLVGCRGHLAVTSGIAGNFLIEADLISTRL